ncbi:hypothetical protein B6I21_00980 [candidate division KSB1 bacterium 4572_119]|nr:MAG: hypothetical protein B6I21_00980 [candidate division KSB1 bacterium 4572_119]
MSEKDSNELFNHKDEVQEINVPENQQRERLDQFLVSRLEKISRAQIQKLIKQNKISVNKKKVKSSHQVVGGETIIIHIPPPKSIDLLPENIPLNIIYEDDSLLVLNKPAGLVVHPAYGNMSGTLANALVYHSQQLSTLSGDYRPGLVHRLDKDTSGLMVVAKNNFVHSALSEQFSAHTTIREYRAFVWGIFNESSGRIESYITRNPKDRTQMIVSDEGRWAVTNYEVLDEFGIVSYVKLRLETGRTHQIRVHMAHKHHPVLGDQIYGGRQKQIIHLNQKFQQMAIQSLKMMPRQALHAKTLGFIHPDNNKEMKFDSELPEDMARLNCFLEEQKETIL